MQLQCTKKIGDDQCSILGGEYDREKPVGKKVGTYPDRRVKFDWHDYFMTSFSYHVKQVKLLAT